MRMRIAALTVSASVEVDHASYSDVNNAKKALVLLLELLLVEDLNRQDTLFVCPPARKSAVSYTLLYAVSTHISKLSFQ